MLNSPTSATYCTLFFFWVYLLLWGHMKSLIYDTPLESEEDLLARIMAASDDGVRSIGDHVYQNKVRSYTVCDEVAGRHIEPFL